MIFSALNQGQRHFWLGCRLLRHRELRAFILIPLLINLVLFCALLWGGYHLIGGWVQAVMTSLPAWLSWLTGFLQATLWLLLLIALSYVFLWMAAFIAAPFNAQLAEKTIAVVFGDGGQSAWQLKTLLKDLGPTLIRELQKFWYWFPKAVLLLLLILIPIFNLAVPLLSFLFNAWMLSVQSLDYNYENDRIAFPHALMQLRQHRAALIGFGAPAGLMALIPIVNFFVLPATVIGGAVLWYRLQMPAPITSSQQL